MASSDSDSSSASSRHQTNRPIKGVYEAYMREKEAKEDKKLGPKSTEKRLIESYSVLEIIKKIGKEHQWSEAEIQSDIDYICIKNRLKTVGELRLLGKKSWDELEIIPLLKELLKIAIKEKKERKSVKEVTKAFNSVGIDNSNDRITIRDGDKVYEVDRYCPHKGADLTCATVENGQLICPKHKWAFDLEKEGLCTKKDATINACRVAW